MKKSSNKTGFLNLRLLFAGLLCLCAVSLAVAGVKGIKKQRPRPTLAPIPPMGQVSDSSPTLSYTDGPFVVPNATAEVSGEPDCTVPMSCSDFALTVGTVSNPATKQVQISVGWPVSTADFDVYVYDSNNMLVGTSASSADPEVVTLPATNNTQYTIRVVPFTPLGQTYTATVSVLTATPAPPPGNAPPGRYLDYPAPTTAAGAESSGEPSLGIDWNPNNAALKIGPNPPTPGSPPMNNVNQNIGGVTFFTANLNEFRVDFDDCSSPARNVWTDVTNPTEGVTTLDPIGFVDHQLPTSSGVESGTGLGRVFQTQLAGATSITSFSQDDGATYTQSQGSGQPAGVDHETDGGGPYAPTDPGSGVIEPPHPLYRHQIYYASQDVGTAFAARSDDGGLTFGPGVPMWNITQCGGLHGHVKVGPDGTVYVPNKSCTDGSSGVMGASVAVSRDNGLTWTIKQVHEGSYYAGSGDTDPSIGIGSDNTIYLGYQNNDGTPHIAVSRNHGDSWHDVNVSQGVIKNTVFPEVVAGDGDRAAFGFVGTATAGSYSTEATFTGVWYFYIATTVDRGQTYTLVDATNGDPVQVGSICTLGTTCGDDRNLLDFNDLQIDAEGRVMAAYADGCLAPGCNAAIVAAHGPPYDESRSALGTVIRQSGGPRLLKAFDTEANCTDNPSLACAATAPGAPRVESVTQNANHVVHLEWSQPDNGGSPLTGYKVYRKDSVTNTYTVIATITQGCPACKASYDDTTATNPNATYTYKVSALNAVGESDTCGEFPVTSAPPPQNRCVTPGITLVTDASGDETDGVSQSDIESVSIAEPYDATTPTKNEVFFTLKVNNLTPTPLPLRRWTVFFSRGSTQWFVAMETDSMGLPNYVYGHTTKDATTGETTLNTDGTPDFGSETADGTITLGIGTPTTNSGGMAFPPIVTGEQLNDINATTQDSLAVLLVTDDSTGTATYTVTGNSSCAPNQAPIAALIAYPVGTSPGTPPTGNPPLAIHFDASGSSDPDGDAIVNYTFDFGDGSTPVSSSSPTTDHTYTTNGTFNASVTVTDSRGAMSTNLASKQIIVTLPLTDAVSRKTHGSAGTFDIDLLASANGTYTTECRIEGNGYKIVYTFANNFTVTGSAASVTVSNGGMVASHGSGPNANQYQVTITNVTDAQSHNITLNGLPVHNSATSANGGNATLNTVVARLDLLVGDVNDDRFTNGGDTTVVRGAAGQTVGQSNFRADVNVDGFINGGDTTIVRQDSGTSLP